MDAATVTVGRETGWMMLSAGRRRLMGVAVHDSNLHSEQASGLELRRHIEVSRNW